MTLPLATSTWDDEEYAAIQRVIDSDRFSMGPEVEAFEKQFAEFFGAKYALMSNSGSSANLLAVAGMIYSKGIDLNPCLLYTSPSPRDLSTSRMPSSA